MCGPLVQQLQGTNSLPTVRAAAVLGAGGHLSSTAALLVLTESQFWGQYVFNALAE